MNLLMLRGKVDLRRLVERGDRLWLAVLGSAGAALILAIALAALALAPRPRVLVPSAAVVVPDEVSDEAMRNFARLWVLTFDNYTPATIERATAALKARVGALAWTRVAEDLDRRVRVVNEGRMSSQAVVVDAEVITRKSPILVRVSAARRLFIADRLSKESSMIYHLALEPVAPTAANPNGLAVLSQRVEELDENRSR